MLQRERRKIVPKLPTSVYSVYETLLFYGLVQNVLLVGHVTTEENNGVAGEAVLFSTPNLLAALAGASHVFIDGTFSVC